MPSSLADTLALLEDSDDVTFTVTDDSGHDHAVKFIDDYGLGGRPGEFFVAGHEFGPTHLIHASSWESAWEAWIDACLTIPEDEVIEAFGIVDDYREEYEKTHPAPPHYAYQGSVTMQAEADAWWRDYRAACKARLLELSETDNPPDLVEGYEYQSNASGTGIVDVGHYAWLNAADLDHVTFARKGADAKEGSEG